MRGRLNRGQALVEFAFVVPVLLLLLLGTMHFGYSFYTYDNLQKAVRDGGLYAARRAYGTGEVANWRSEAQNVVLYGTPNGSGNPVVHGLARANVVVTVAPATGAPKYVTVQINGYALPSILPGVGGVTLSNKPAARFPFIGRWIP